MVSSSMCRICESATTMSHIFTKDDQIILEKMRFFFNQPIEANDLLPQCICTDCITKLNNAYNFKTQYEITNRKYVKAASSISQVDRIQFSDQIVEKSNSPSNYELKEEKFEINQVEVTCESSTLTAENFYVSKIFVKKELSPKYLDDGTNGEKDEAIGDEDASTSTVSIVKMYHEDEDVDDDNEDPEYYSSTMEDGLVEDSECSTKESGESNKREEAKSHKKILSIPHDMAHSNDVIITNGSLVQNGPWAPVANACKRLVSATAASNSDFNCLKCNKRFTNEEAWTEHEWSHEKPDFKCKKCGKQFSCLQPLRYHVRLHKVSKCKVCGMNSIEYLALKRHEIAHSNFFECSNCGKRIPIHLTHTESFQENFERSKCHKDFKCSKCNETFTNEQCWTEHKLSHENRDLLKCHKCGKRFSNGESLRQHAKIQCGPDTYKCKKCGKNYPNSLALKLHEMAHSIDFKCSKCSKVFKFRSTLIEHELSHENQSVS